MKNSMWEKGIVLLISVMLILSIHVAAQSAQKEFHTTDIPVTVWGFVFVDGNITDPDQVTLIFPGNISFIADLLGSGAYITDFDADGLEGETGIFEVDIYGHSWIAAETIYISGSGSYPINLTVTTFSPNEVYVDDDYNASTPGWGYDHFDSIQDGVDAINESGTVYVYTGVYNERIRINKSINLIGEDKNSTIIDGNNVSDVTVRIFVDNVNISGFTIQESGDGYSGLCTYANNTNISNNIVKSNGYHGITVRYWNNNTISNNIVFGNNQGGINLQDSSSYNVISRNNISSHDNYGIRIRDSSSNNIIYHNNLINNTQNGYDVNTNTWYNAVLQQGNYWSDFDEPSEGAWDNDSNGIVDSPYDIPGDNNQDLYPLMHHFELYLILDIILEDSEVDEGTDFNVTVKSEGGTAIPEAIVEFNDELKLTDMDGRVYFTAPQVGADTTYDIIATKEGYTGDSETILVKDVAVEFVSTFIFGRIDNLTIGGDVITFEAVNIRCMTFFPFTFNAYTSGELITISKNPKGFVGALLGMQLIFALCDAYIGG